MWPFWPQDYPAPEHSPNKISWEYFQNQQLKENKLKTADNF